MTSFKKRSEARARCDNLTGPMRSYVLLRLVFVPEGSLLSGELGVAPHPEARSPFASAGGRK